MNQQATDRIGRIKIGIRVESDHQPLEVTLIEKMKRENNKIKKVFKKIVQWKEDSSKKYQKKVKEIKIEESVEELWENLKKGVKECLIRKKIKEKRLGKKKIGEKEWWNKKCKKMKRKVKKV